MPAQTEITEGLFKLQTLKKNLKKVAVKRAGLPAMMEAAEKKETELKTNLLEFQDLEASLTQKQKDQAQRQRAIEDRLTKLQERETLISTQREFESLEKENNQHRAELGRIREFSLKTEKEYQDLQGKIKETQDLIEHQETRINQVKEEITRQENEFDEKTQAIEEEISEAEAAIPTAILQSFYKVSEQKGSGLVTISREGVCQTCNLTVPPQTVSQIQRAAALLQCGTCGRFRCVR